LRDTVRIGDSQAWGRTTMEQLAACPTTIDERTPLDCHNCVAATLVSRLTHARITEFTFSAPTRRLGPPADATDALVLRTWLGEPVEAGQNLIAGCIQLFAYFGFWTVNFRL
jgi:hypothetical protein